MKRTWALILIAVVATLTTTPLNAEEVTPVQNVPSEASKVLVASSSPTTRPAPQAALMSEIDRTSYAIGVQIGVGLKSEGLEVSPALIAQAIADVLASKPLAMDEQEIIKITTKLQQDRVAKQQAELQQLAQKNLSEGQSFLAENATKEGIQVLPSGLQYKVLQEGSGNIPTAEDRVKTHYRGTLLSGQEFDSSYRRGQPVEFPVRGVIAGWTEALQLMKEGAKWQLFIPGKLAYGERGRPGIPPNSVLIFEIELLEIVK